MIVLRVSNVIILKYITLCLYNSQVTHLLQGYVTDTDDELSYLHRIMQYITHTYIHVISQLEMYYISTNSCPIPGRL